MDDGSKCRLLPMSPLVLLDMYCIHHIASRKSSKEWEFKFPVLSFEFLQFPKVGVGGKNVMFSNCPYDQSKYSDLLIISQYDVYKVL
jgi:hypothetical protein